MLTDLAIVAQHLGQLLELERQALLQGEDIGRGGADALGHQRAPMRPGVVAILGRAVADVERHHSELGGIGGIGCIAMRAAGGHEGTEDQQRHGQERHEAAHGASLALPKGPWGRECGR